jgi:hypothetical protein
MSSIGAKARFSKLGGITGSDNVAETSDTGGYVAKAGDSMSGQLVNTDSIWIPSGTFVLGNYPPSSFYWYGAYPNNSYLTMDKATADNDASLVFTQGGRAKWEFGATTELPGDSPRIHLKKVENPTSDGADDVFLDVFIWDYDTGNGWVPRGYKFGIGNVPLERFHVSDNPDDARVIAKIENYNAAAGSQSAVWQFQGGANSWVLGNDYGLNGGDNFFLQGSSGGLKMFVNVNGVCFGGGSSVDGTEALRVDSTTQGILPPRLTKTQRDAMGAKTTSLMIYNSTIDRLQWWYAPAAEWRSPQVVGVVAEFVAERTVNYCAWGDSLTAGAGGTPWPDVFNQVEGPASMRNEGVGGDTSTQIRTRFLAASPATLNNVQVIWAGRNNFGSPTTVKADIAAMIAALGHTRYLVLGIVNQDDVTEYSGSAYLTIIDQLNTDLATLYGDKFIDIRRILIDKGLAMAGLTATAQDTTDIANDVPPSSLRSDTLHYNSYGYAVVGQVVHAFMNRATDRTGLVDTSSAQTISGVKTFSTVPVFDAGISIGTGGSFAQGKVYYDATLGLVHAAKSGATYDWGVYDLSGSVALSMAASTKNLTAWGTLNVVGGITENGVSVAVGHEAASANWDSHFTANKGVFFNENTGAANQPVAGRNWSGLTLPGSNSNNAAQLAFSNTSASELYFRRRAAGVNQPWVRALTTEDAPVLSSGTYTPTLTNVANVSASTAYPCQWMRVGNVVTVSGKLDIDPTTASTSTRIGISLPVASNFAAEHQCGGTAVSPTATPNVAAGIGADLTNDRAHLEYICGTDVAARRWNFSFTYQVI